MERLEKRGFYSPTNKTSEKIIDWNATDFEKATWSRGSRFEGKIVYLELVESQNGLRGAG